MSVCCECCVLSGIGLCDEIITYPEESYRLWCVVVCDLENLVNEEALAHWGTVAPKTNKQNIRICVVIFRLGRKIEKSDCSFCDVRLSVCMKHLGSHWTDFS